MKEKLRIVFVPFISALLGLTVGYTLLDLLLFTWLGVFHPREELREIVLPVLLAVVVTFFYIAPKLKVLKLHSDFFHTFLALLGLALSTIFAQKYGSAISGRQTMLWSVENLESGTPTKYYDLVGPRIDTTAQRYHATYKVVGRRANTLKMYFYVVMPIRDSDTNTLSHEPTLWLGAVYEDEVDMHESIETMERSYDAFVGLSQVRAGQDDFSHFACYERVDKSSEHFEGFANAVGQGVHLPTDLVILQGMNVPYEARAADSGERLLTSLLIAIVVWLLLCVIPKVNSVEMERIRSGKPDLMRQVERQEYLDLIIPHKGYFVTPIIMYANIVLFFLMVFAGKGFLTFQPDDLTAWGASYAPMVAEGEWWRLVTAIFLHGGLEHLVANMVCLFYVGIHLEKLMSRGRYLCIYLLSGLAGSTVSLLWHTEPGVAVGASGAIFGLYGAYIAQLAGGVYPKSESRLVLREMLIIIGVNLLVGIVPGIDNAAHIGGLVCGLLLGFMFLVLSKEKEEQKGIPRSIKKRR